MLSQTEFTTVDERLESIRTIVDMVSAENKESETFHNILRSWPYEFFNEWQAGKEYFPGNVYTYNKMKYLVIKNTPASLTTDPSIYTMREYSLPYQGVWPNLWAFKEPILSGTLRYLYNQEGLYRAKTTITSAQNTAPPNENLNLWELVI